MSLLQAVLTQLRAPATPAAWLKLTCPGAAGWHRLDPHDLLASLEAMCPPCHVYWQARLTEEE